MNKPTSLICSCCGARTMGRQWHNRDKGYGLCSGCGDWIKSRGESKETMKQNYGEEGVHYSLPLPRKEEA